MMNDVTNSKKDWNDFWYNSDQIHSPQTNNYYNQLVDYQVSTMKKTSPQKVTQSKSNYSAPFDTDAYANYRDSVTVKERKSFDQLYKEYSAMSIPEQITNLKQLGKEFVTKIDKVIDQLDVILKDDFDPTKVTCSVDDKEVDCNTWEEENSSV